jgi:hypothetical protein
MTQHLRRKRQRYIPRPTAILDDDDCRDFGHVDQADCLYVAVDTTGTGTYSTPQLAARAFDMRVR